MEFTGSAGRSAGAWRGRWGLGTPTRRLARKSGRSHHPRGDHRAPLRRPHDPILTGQAGHADTIRAINQAGLNPYLAKPWAPQELVRIVREQLTHYVIEAHLDPLPYLSTLDPTPLLESLRQSGPT